MMLASVQTSADTVPLPMYALGIAEWIAGTVLLIGVLGLLWHGPIIRFIERRSEIRTFGREIDRYDAEQTTLARRTR